MSKQLEVEEFVVTAIRKLYNPCTTGIHVSYSGFAQVFQLYYPDKDLQETLKELKKKKKIVVIGQGPNKMIYRSTDPPQRVLWSSKRILEIILSDAQ